MPIYEYRCEECGHFLDALQKVNDEPLKDCPNCQKETLKRLLSKTAFQLKGDGWYVTDFKNSGKPAASSSSTESTSSETTKPTTGE